MDVDSPESHWDYEFSLSGTNESSLKQYIILHGNKSFATHCEDWNILHLYAKYI